MTGTPAATDMTLRPVGFFLLMVGLGLRLDTTWQAVAWPCIAIGAVCGGTGLWMLYRRSVAAAFTPPGRGG